MRQEQGREKRCTLQLPQCLPTCQLIACLDLTWVQAHDKEVFCLFEELTGKDYDCFHAIANRGEMGN